MRKVLGVLVLSTVAMVASGASISLVDNFNTAATTAAPGAPVTTALLAPYVSWSRTTTVTPTGASVSINTVTSPNLWSYENPPLVPGPGVPGWASASYSMGAPFNMTSSFGYDYIISATVVFNDIGTGPLQFFLDSAATGTVYTTAGANMPTPLGLPVTISASLSSFVTNPAALNSVNSFGFTVFHTGQPGADTALSQFSIGEVPEPGTYALMGAGLAALAFLRRRK